MTGWFSVSGSPLTASGLLDVLVNTTRDGFALVSGERGIVGFNQKFRDMWGLPQVEGLDGREVLRHVVDRLTASHRAFLTGRRRGERRRNQLLKLQDGRVFEGHSSIIDDGSGLLLWTFRDVTEQLQVEEELRELARTDPLTGLANRRGFLERLEHERARHDRFGHPFSVVLADVDHFKRFNDSYGHACGDAALVHVSRVMGNALREVDLSARWGGEEFISILPETNAIRAYETAKRVQRALREDPFVCEDAEPLTLTLGVAQYVPSVRTDDVIRRADSALYQGKREGRNRVIVWRAERAGNRHHRTYPSFPAIPRQTSEREG